MKNALEQIIQAYEEEKRNITNNAQMRKKFNQTIKSLEKQLDEVGNNCGGTSQDCNEYDGDPVNMCNGNFVEKIQELKIAGRIPLEFTRVYNAMGGKETVMGMGWSCNYMDHLEKKGEAKKIALIERNGEKTVYVHDEKNRHVKTIHEDGEERFSYNEKNKRVLYTDPMGNSFQITFDNRGYITSVIDEVGNITHYTYDAKNHLVSLKDPFGNQ